MQGQDAFSGYHPLVNLCYFVLVIGCTMFSMHPLCLLISFWMALVYSIELYGGRETLAGLRYAIPLVLLAACLNLLFNHQGTHILWELPGGSVLTAESFLYGIAAGAMLVAVLLWFRCYSAVMTSDKFIYLFGRILPSLSLVLSMTLRQIPRFRARLEEVREARRGLGQDENNATLRQRCRSALACFSGVVTWALESGLETADSMKGRGYGLKGRTSYAGYTITGRDIAMLVWLCLSGLGMFLGALGESLSWQYFPSLEGRLTEPWTLMALGSYLALCATPWILNRREALRWHILRSRI